VFVGDAGSAISAGGSQALCLIPADDECSVTAKVPMNNENAQIGWVQIYLANLSIKVV